MLPVFKKFKKKVAIVLILLIAVVSMVAIFQSGKVSKKGETVISSELARAMTYDRVQEGDEATNSEYVNFDAFFLRDLDGDGYAEEIRGTCRQVGYQDTLYMNLKVQGSGYLKDGKITINSKNMYLETAIPKDNDVKSNAIGSNVKEITFNDLSTGTQRLFSGVVKSGNYNYESSKADAIGNNINNYSQVNSVTLIGVHVAPDGTETPVEKTVDFDIDWYAVTETEIANYLGSDSFDYINQEQQISTMIDEENNEINLKFDVLIKETKNEALLSKAQIEMDVPQLNGYNPIRVDVADSDCQYDKNTRKLVASKSATVNDDGKITKNIYTLVENKRYTKFTVTVTYELDAYRSIGADSVETQFKTKAFMKDLIIQMMSLTIHIDQMKL